MRKIVRFPSRMVMALALLAPVATQAQLIIPTESFYDLTSDDNNASIQTAQFSDPTIPRLQQTIVPDGGILNDTTYQVSGDNINFVTYRYDFDHSHVGEGFSETFSRIVFDVVNPVQYSITGEWDLAGIASSFSQQAILDDLDNAQQLFRSDNGVTAISPSGHVNPSYDLGEVDGSPEVSGTIGNQTGTLAPGEYRITTDHFYGNALGEDGSASGYIQISLTAVPEPATAAFVVLGLLGLVSVKKSRRPDRVC